MSDNEIRELLEDNNYIIKQHIALCNERDKALPLRVYQRNLKALNEFNTTKEQVSNLTLLTGIETQKLNTQETSHDIFVGGASLLLESGLLVENQVRHYKNYGFIAKCNEFIGDYGTERFKNVLARVKQYKDNGVKINNIYGYISKALDTEAKEVNTNA